MRTLLILQVMKPQLQNTKVAVCLRTLLILQVMKHDEEEALEAFRLRTLLILQVMKLRAPGPASASV